MKILEGYESCRDESTGLLDRTGFIEMAELELDRAARNHTSFTVLYLDLDHLESIPYQSREMLLLVFVADLLDHVRKSDIVSRLGENQFVILMPDTGVESVSKILPILRESLHNELDKYDWKVMARIGAITYLTPPYDGESIVRMLDHLMKSNTREFQVLEGRKVSSDNLSPQLTGWTK